MKLGVVNRITTDSFKRNADYPKWFDEFVASLNDTLEKITLALQGRLTFEDNFLCKVFEANFTNGTEQVINPFPTGSANLKVKGVIPVSGGGLPVDTFKWEQKSDGRSIGVTISFSSGTTATCKIIILLGE